MRDITSGTDACVTVAVGQFASVADVSANLSVIERLASSAAQQGASVLVLPEAAMYPFLSSATELADAARRDGRRFEAEVQALAKRCALTIVVGMYSEGSGHLARNTFIVAGTDGRTIGRYNKLHLYDAFEARESDNVEQTILGGDFRELCTFDAGGLRFGVINCYDLRFPEMARALVDKGADVLLVGAGWAAGPTKEVHWETLLRARAIENTCYVAAACQPPPLSVGMSMIIDPMGLTAAMVVEGEGIVVATLKGERLRAVRKILPCLEHRRYAIDPSSATSGSGGFPTPPSRELGKESRRLETIA